MSITYVPHPVQQSIVHSDLLGDINVLFGEIALRDFSPGLSPYPLIIAQIGEKVNGGGILILSPVLILGNDTPNPKNKSAIKAF